MANFKPRDMRSNQDIYKQLYDLLRQDYTVKSALAVVGRSQSWWETRRREDKEFASMVDAIRGSTKDIAARRVEVPDFPAFSAEYLGNQVWPHMQNIVDVLRGDEPGFLHPSMTYERGSSGNKRVIVNVPPN